MWAKLDDALLDHRKLIEAGRALGKDGRAKALGLYSGGLLYSQKHLTDGVLTREVVEAVFGGDFLAKPIEGARAMVKAGLWEAVEGGFRVHDYHDHNPQAADVLEKRRRDRERKHKSNGRN